MSLYDTGTHWKWCLRKHQILLLKRLILSHFQNCSHFFSRCTNEPDPPLSVFCGNCNFHIFNSNWPLSRQKVFCPAAKSESCLGWDWDFIIKSFWRNCPLALTVFFFLLKEQCSPTYIRLIFHHASSVLLAQMFSPRIGNFLFACFFMS